MKTPGLSKFFLAVSGTYLFLLLFNWASTALPLKPFLMPPLIFWVYFQNDFPTKKFLIGALIFSWIGDVVLMFSGINALFFIGGLISFLIAHVLYLILFYREKSLYHSENKTIVSVGLFAVVAYLASMLIILMPHLGGMRLPVIVYALTISSMLGMAIFQFNGWQAPAKYRILIGAVAFVISDSILAFNKFYQPFAAASFLIMLTYLAAQYFIVSGILKLRT